MNSVINGMHLKNYANEKNIRIVGDIPIFVDHNSSDVWANPHYFAVDEKEIEPWLRVYHQIILARPDSFGETPQYNWEELEKDGFSWWVDRFKHMFNQCDAIELII